MPSILLSSVNPQEVALTVKGLLVAIIPFALIAARYFQVDIGESELNQLIGGIGDAIIAVGAAASVVMTVYGLGRKIYSKIKTLTSTPTPAT